MTSRTATSLLSRSRSTAPLRPNLVWIAQLITFGLVVFSCAGSSNVETLPLGSTRITIPVAGLFPEGLAYDSTGDRFLVGSLATGQILEIADNGSISEFAELGGSLTGLEIDLDRDRLLVAITSLARDVAQMATIELSTGRLESVVNFAELSTTDRLFANDIAVDDSGVAYVTNSAEGQIFSVGLDGVANVLVADAEFDPVDSGGLNGIAYIDGLLIVGHSGTGRFFSIPTETPKDYQEISTDVDDLVIDGLTLSADRSRLAVASNSGFVSVFESDDGWVTMDEVGRFAVGPGFPTTIAERDGSFYVLLAHLDQYPNPEFEPFEIQQLAT